MPRYAMVIDTKKCVGCQACTVACQAEWGLPPGERFCRVESREEGSFPSVTRQIIPIQCMHCADAPCIDVCPTKASYRREDGIVLVDEKRCAGCKYCMVACPYQARVMNHDSGVPEKCRFCYHRLNEGKEPACVNTCIGNARVFGDLDNPDSEVAKLVARQKAQPLRTDLGTKPSIYYVR